MFVVFQVLPLTDLVHDPTAVMSGDLPGETQEPFARFTSNIRLCYFLYYYLLVFY